MKHPSATVTNIEIRRLGYYGLDQPPPSRPALSREEEHAAFVRYAKRKTAKDREMLVRQYLCWAFHIACRYKGPRLEFDEAVSVANEGLVEALNRYDPSRGFRFTTYAFFIVRRKLVNAILATYPVRVSDHVRKSLRGVEPEAEAAALCGQGEPRTLDEIFERLGEGYPSNELEGASEEPNPGQAAELSDREKTLQTTLSAALETLGEFERELVMSRSYRPRKESYDSLARRFHLSKTTIRDTYELALVKLRRQFNPELHT
jgi:RNA polymerase sigma factor (sigma-70 family)